MLITYQNSCLKKLDRRGDRVHFFRDNLRQPERAKKPMKRRRSYATMFPSNVTKPCMAHRLLRFQVGFSVKNINHKYS